MYLEKSFWQASKENGDNNKEVLQEVVDIPMPAQIITDSNPPLPPLPQPNSCDKTPTANGETDSNEAEVSVQ